MRLRMGILGPNKMSVEGETTTVRDSDQTPNEPELIKNGFIWGDRMILENEKTLRIGVANVGGLPVDSTKGKMRNIVSFVEDHNFSIFGVPKVNINWQLMPPQEQLVPRLRYTVAKRNPNQDIKTTTAYYKDFSTSLLSQAGGTTQWAFDTAVHRIHKTGEDPTNLGRWVWQSFRGKEGKILRVITAYRPCKSANGVTTVMNQHKVYFMNKDNDSCPRKIFVTQLCEEVKKWLEEGDHIVIVIDLNEDIRKSEFTTKMAEMGLREAITAKHGNQGPATRLASSKPIDGIFVTQGLLQCDCGYIISPGDHFCLWMDINFQEILGYEKDRPVPFQARRLLLQDPRVVKRYTAALETRCEEHHLSERAQLLTKTMSIPPTEAQTREYEKMDHLRTQAMLEAEKKCRKLKTGHVAWTPTFSNLERERKAWLAVVKHLNPKQNIKTYFYHRQVAAGKIEVPDNICLEEAEAQLAEVKHKMSLYKTNSIDSRKSWLEDVAEAQVRAANQNEEPDKAELARKTANRLTSLIRTEEQRRSARIIKIANKKIRESTSINSVIVQDEHNQPRQLFKKEQIEQALLLETGQRFNQSAETPFMQTPLVELVGPSGNSSYVEQILQGTAEIPSGIDEFAERLILHLCYPDNYNGKETVAELNIEDHTRGWSRARERTSAGPSGLHFGHFKAMSTSEILAELSAIMAFFPYKTGYSPERWRQGIQVMLMKQIGNLNVGKLRAILLFEADYNFNNKTLG
jgi:hypothetical protein